MVVIYLLTVSPMGFLSPVKADLMGNDYMYITGLLLGLNVIAEKVWRPKLLKFYCEYKSPGIQIESAGLGGA